MNTNTKRVTIPLSELGLEGLLTIPDDVLEEARKLSIPTQEEIEQMRNLVFD